jgi:hypothetical protein
MREDRHASANVNVHVNGCREWEGTRRRRWQLHACGSAVWRGLRGTGYWVLGTGYGVRGRGGREGGVRESTNARSEYGEPKVSLWENGENLTELTLLPRQTFRQL